MTNQEPDLIDTLEAVFGKENVFVIDESYKFEQEDPMGNLSSDTRHLDGQDEQWVHVARRWTAIWDEVPMPGIGVDEAEAKAKSDLYDQLHYDTFKAEFPTWDFSHFESSRINITDDVILHLWDHDHSYWIHMEASEDAPFWLLTSYDAADFDNRTIYTFND